MPRRIERVDETEKGDLPVPRDELAGNIGGYHPAKAEANQTIWAVRIVRQQQVHATIGEMLDAVCAFDAPQIKRPYGLARRQRAGQAVKPVQHAIVSRDAIQGRPRP